MHRVFASFSQSSRRSRMRAPNDKMVCPVLITMGYWVILSMVVSTTGNLHMDIFRNTMRERFPDRNIDMNQLLRKYTEICPYLTQCDLDHLVEPAPTVYNRADVSIPSCQPCDCSFWCMQNGNCCPGSPFQYIQYEEVNFTVYSGHYRPPKMVYMITHCPTRYNENKTIIDRCMGDESVLYPAKSWKTELMYKNKYCAICNNETSFYEYALNLYCLNKKEDVTKDIDDILNRKDCWLSFFLAMPTFGSPVDPVAKVRDEESISTCNVTGQWKQFDQDVHWACENMVYLYQGFKNPFCYICNPSISSSQADHTRIDSCNATGNWMKYSQKVENACLSGSETQRLFPFKNIQCLICNGGFGIRNETTFNVSIAGKVYQSQLNITLQFNTINAAGFLKEIQTIFNESGLRLNTSLNMIKNRVDIGNISIVMDRFESICGKWPNRYCRFQGEEFLMDRFRYLDYICSSPGNTRYSECICSTDCAESKRCCPYMLWKFSPYSCVRAQSFPSWNVNVSMNTSKDPNLHMDVLMIDECLSEHNVDAYFRFNSVDTSTENLIDIPARTDSDIMYKNLSYLLCNTAQQIAYVDFRLQCSEYIEYRPFTDIGKLLKIAKQYCSIHVLPLNTKPCSKQYSNILKNHHLQLRTQVRIIGNLSETSKRAILSAHTWTPGKLETYSRCNQTNKWQVEDRDIKLICEGDNVNVLALPEYKHNGVQYKNFACFICNPLLREDEIDQVISTCNVTGALTWQSDYYSRLCAITKYEERYLPFKNFYCSLCNLLRPVQAEFYIGNTNRHGAWLFAISEKQWRIQVERKAHPMCFNRTNYPVQDECRDVICSRMHYLENGSCKSVHSEITAVLSFELSWRHFPCMSSPCSQRYCDTMKLDLLLESIVNYISYTAVTEISDERLYYSGYVGSSCNRKTRIFKISASPTLLFSLTCWYTDNEASSISPTEFETKLVAFLDREHILNITSGNETMNTCRIAFQPVPKSFHTIKKNNHFPSKMDECYMLYNRFNEPYERHEVVVVDRYLLCPQLEFSSDEYRHNTADDTVTITSNGVTFKSDYFKKQGTAIRICLKDYEEHLSRTHIFVQNTLMEAYNVFSDIVISISLICLALTFTTYCLHCSLQTLPGKNIMLLTVCLMCAQSLLLFALHLESNTVICKTMGILIHYFWLATYCSMNVCSFHLFHVFYINAMTKATPESDNRRFAVYLAYTLGVPFLVVVATISIFAIPSHGQALGYGEILCFLSDINASITAFITPSILVFASNIVFFALAFHKIRTTGKVQASRNSERSDVFICFRICTIIGITGPLYLLNAFIGFSYFSFVVEGINSLQGLLIFLSYICNRRVLALFREKFSLGNPNAVN